MILGFVPSEESDPRGVLYNHIPQPKQHEIQIGPKTRPNIVVVSTVQQLQGLVTEHTRGIIYVGRAYESVIIPSQNKGEEEKYNPQLLPILHGAKIRLPYGHRYSGKVSISDRKQSWGETCFMTDSISSYLAPRFITSRGFILSMPEDRDFIDVRHDLGLRRKLFVALGLPGQILVLKNGDVIVNPK